jgi:hypothetical protein
MVLPHIGRARSGKRPLERAGLHAVSLTTSTVHFNIPSPVQVQGQE